MIEFFNRPEFFDQSDSDSDSENEGEQFQKSPTKLDIWRNISRDAAKCLIDLSDGNYEEAVKKINLVFCS